MPGPALGAAPCRGGERLWRSNGSSTPRADNCSALGLRLSGSCVPSHYMAASSPTHPIGVRWDSGGAQGQTAAKGTSRRGKMSPSETIKLLNKIRCLSECSLFFSVCLGSATLTSWPYRGAAEWTGLIAQETDALANFSTPVKPGQELNAFALQKNSSLSFPSFLSATP